MAVATALRVELSGEMPQWKLDKMRELLGLMKRGRLDDDEDANFGFRNLQRDEANRVRVDLYRSTPTEWLVELTYLSDPPTADVVDRLRSEFLSAASQLGLTVNSVV
jgi:hypothetical protein